VRDKETNSMIGLSIDQVKALIANALSKEATTRQEYYRSKAFPIIPYSPREREIVYATEPLVARSSEKLHVVWRNHDAAFFAQVERATLAARERCL
jgi:hypothetical protein